MTGECVYNRFFLTKFFTKKEIGKKFLLLYLVMIPSTNLLTTIPKIREMLWSKNNDITYFIFLYNLLFLPPSTLFWKTAQMFATSWKWTLSLSWKLDKYTQLAKARSFCYIHDIKMCLFILWKLINVGKAFGILGRNKLQLISMCEFTTQKA